MTRPAIDSGRRIEVEEAISNIHDIPHLISSTAYSLLHPEIWSVRARTPHRLCRHRKEGCDEHPILVTRWGARFVRRNILAQSYDGRRDRCRPGDRLQLLY